MYMINGHIHQQVSSPRCLENELFEVYWMHVLYFLGNKLFWIGIPLKIVCKIAAILSSGRMIKTFTLMTFLYQHENLLFQKTHLIFPNFEQKVHCVRSYEMNVCIQKTHHSDCLS